MLDEWKAIVKRPILWATMIGLALIPALYNVIFLSSMWDPYGQVDQLPVAIVNQDHAVTYQGKRLTIGRDMVDNMSKNKALDYHFVKQSEAEKGLAKGKYFMIVTLPKDLSENAASLLTEHPKQLSISYQTSKGHSFVASKMAESAMNQLKANVAKNITYTYTHSLFNNISKLTTGLGKASDGSQDLSEGSQKLEDGSKLLSDNLTKLANSSLTFSDGAETLAVGLGQYTTGVAQLSSGLSTLNSGMSRYTQGVDSLASGASQLDAVSADLLNGVSQLTGVSQQMQPLVDGSNQLTAGLTELSNQVGLSQEEQEQIGQLSQGLEQLNAALQSLGTGQTDLSAASSSLSELASLAQSLLTASANDSATTQTALQATAAYQSLSTEQQAEIMAAVAPSGITSQVQSLLEQISHLQASLSGLDTGTQAAGLSQIQGIANTVLPAASSSLSRLSSGIGQVSSVLVNQIIPGSNQVAAGVSSLQSQLGAGAGQLQAGVEQYTTAVASLAAGANQLSSNSGQLRDGLGQLQAGATTLDEKSPQLIAGIGQLANGASQISDGSSQLSQGGQTLSSGLASLTDGANELSRGLIQAKDKLSTISTDRDNAKGISNPVKLSHSDKDQVKTNGIGMAPYMMSVALMVVALSSNMIFTKTVSGEAPKNRIDWVSRKLAVNGVIAVLAGTILYFAVHLIGVTANHEGKTYVLTILASLTFMAMVTAFYTLHERLGAFMSLIVLLLQLGSSAGTYPLALTNKFFQTINPFLPMSYTVSGLRQTISMSGHIGQELLILSLFLLIFTGLGAGVYTRKRSRS